MAPGAGQPRRVPLPDALAAVADAQGGPFTRGQALASGLSAWAVRRLLAEQCVELCHGVHAERVRAALALADPRRALVLRASAQVLLCEGAVLSHRTAAVAHGWPLVGGLPAVPDLTRAPRRSGDTSSVRGVRVADLPSGHRTVLGAIPVTTAARTVVDVARTQPVRRALVVADAALARGLDPGELATTAAELARWPGGRRAVEVVRGADGRAETPLESLTRWAYAEQGLPPPESQVELYGPDGQLLGRVDFLWRAQRVIGEADGMGKYDVPGSLREEKRREERLRRAGFEVVRNDWDDVWRSAGRVDLGRRVREAFSYALTRPVVAGVSFRSPSLDELRRRQHRIAA
ncbi:MAG: hypothetical protein JWN08_2925 [Frankiales bacterium]|nr:hypothetical protein [Frankiales bacterium]